jgi:hypothetical protein
MKRQVINTNAFLIREWGQSNKRGWFHLDGASVLFIKVPDAQVMLSEQISALSEWVMLGSLTGLMSAQALISWAGILGPPRPSCSFPRFSSPSCKLFI